MGGLLVLASARADAAPAARLVYLRSADADACPDEAAMRKAVAARLGYDPFFPWAANTVFAEIRQSEGRLVGHVKLVDADARLRGEREITQPGEGCADLAQAMALTISIAIDPLSLTRPSSAAPEPAPSTSPASDDEAPVAPAPAPEPKAATGDRPPAERATSPSGSSPATQLTAGAAVHGSVGMAPAAAVGADLFGGVRWRTVSAELGVRADLPASVERSGGRVSSTVIGATAAACVHRAPAFGCALGLAGLFQASGDLATSRDATAPYAATGARVGVAIPLGTDLEIRVPIDLLVTLTRHTLQVDGADAVTLPAFSAAIGLAVAARF